MNNQNTSNNSIKHEINDENLLKLMNIQRNQINQNNLNLNSNISKNLPNFADYNFSNLAFFNNFNNANNQNSGYSNLGMGNFNNNNNILQQNNLLNELTNLQRNQTMIVNNEVGGSNKINKTSTNAGNSHIVNTLNEISSNLLKKNSSFEPRLNLC